jgi:hypothetical protein
MPRKKNTDAMTSRLQKVAAVKERLATNPDERVDDVLQEFGISKTYYYHHKNDPGTEVTLSAAETTTHAPKKSAKLPTPAENMAIVMVMPVSSVSGFLKDALFAQIP